MNKPKEYLQDPDEEMERLGRISSESIQAESLNDAEEKCKELADDYGLELTGVEQFGSKDYDCNFRG